MTVAYLNRVATAVPPHDVHAAFLGFAESQLGEDRRGRLLFKRMASKGGIDHRHSWLSPAPADGGNHAVDAEGFYPRGRFPCTADRMRFFERHAPALAMQAIDKLRLGADAATVTHVVVTSCTGFSAPGLDLEIVERCGLPGSVERTMIGFMGCYAAINALKTARHIVRSEPWARVLLLNLELCTLHLQESQDIEQILSFMVFADGCAASIVSAEPHGLALDRFHAVLAPETSALITWTIREQGFDMVLSGRVPGAIQHALGTRAAEILDGADPAAIDLWAVHPGGRSVLDAVAQALGLPAHALAASRDVLRRFGNMSSATVMFVLETMLREPAGKRGCAMAFGPGLVAETLLFTSAGAPP
jgi:predicted naringenin-chalcone synthase